MYERFDVSSNRQAQAFTLIECMIYLSCATILSLILFGFVSSLYHDVARARASMHCNVYLQLVRDVVRRDLLGAGWQLQDYVLEQNIFKKYWVDASGQRHIAWIGYQVGPKGFARIQGIYDQEAGVWKKKSVSYLPAPMISLDLSYLINEQTKCVNGVVMTYVVLQGGKKSELNDQFIVRNRVL